MAALRARSFGRLGLSADGLMGCVRVPLVATGFVFCASSSETLTLCFSICPDFGGAFCSPVSRGGLVSLISGIVPAMEVSGIPALRGGGGTESSEWGRYAVAV